MVPHVRRSSRQKLSSRVLAVFWGRDGILLVDYLEKGAATTTKYSVAFLKKLKQQLIFKHEGMLL
jgi:hypothetical protein